MARSPPTLGGIDSQGQKLDYAQGQQHAALRSQPASGSRGAESERGESGDPQNPAQLSSEEEDTSAGRLIPQPEPVAAERDSEADGKGDQPARALGRLKEKWRWSYMPAGAREQLVIFDHGAKDGPADQEIRGLGQRY